MLTVHPKHSTAQKRWQTCNTWHAPTKPLPCIAAHDAFDRFLPRHAALSFRRCESAESSYKYYRNVTNAPASSPHMSTTGSFHRAAQAARFSQLEGREVLSHQAHLTITSGTEAVAFTSSAQFLLSTLKAVALKSPSKHIKGQFEILLILRIRHCCKAMNPRSQTHIWMPEDC